MIRPPPRSTLFPTRRSSDLDKPLLKFERLLETYLAFAPRGIGLQQRSEEHTSELQSRGHLVCRLLLEKKNNTSQIHFTVATDTKTTTMTNAARRDDRTRLRS